MPTFSIPLGAPTAILQNVIYALPARGSMLQSSVALELSMDVAGTFTAAGIGVLPVHFGS